MELRGRDPATGSGVRVMMENGMVVAVEDAAVMENVWLSAGLVDLQVNGFAGLDLNGDELAAQTVSALVRRLVETGVTSFAPTLITADKESLLRRLASLDEACRADELAAQCIPFLHMEGPSISPRDGYRGAPPRSSMYDHHPSRSLSSGRRRVVDGLGW